MDLREYQDGCIDGARELLRVHPSTLIIMPTGGGKTVVAAAIIEAAARKGSRALFLAHRRELIKQTADKLLRFGVQPGIVMGGEKRALHRQVQVASVQALAKHPALVGQVDLVFIDEAHHLTAGNQYAKVIQWYPAAKLIGLTATPWRLDGAGLSDVFKSHVLACTPRQLREQGYLVPVGGWEYAPIDTKGASVSGGDFVGVSLERAAMSAKLFGEVISEWKAHANNARTVLFAVSINHSQAMAKAFRDAGVPSEHLDGETPTQLRDAIMNRIRTGETRVLCNVNVATEGWDCPEIECVILARPTLSTSLALQMIGRGLRPAEGKTMLRIHDHARVLASHGHPYAERDWNPEKTVKASRRELEAGVSRVRKCDKCEAVIAQWPCDACGWAPAPKDLVQHELAAQRKAILDSPGWQKAQAKEAKRRADAEAFKLRTHESKRQLYLSLLAKLGPRGALGAYRAISGETEWPPYAWRPPEEMSA